MITVALVVTVRVKPPSHDAKLFLSNSEALFSKETEGGLDDGTVEASVGHRMCRKDCRVARVLWSRQTRMSPSKANRSQLSGRQGRLRSPNDLGNRYLVLK